MPIYRRLAAAMTGLAALAISALPLPAQADYLLACRLPTGRQAVNITRLDMDREKDAHTLANTLVLKYYTPSGLGVLVGMPYVLDRTTPAGKADGFGDINLTALQVFEPVQGLALAPYARTIFPTGAYDSSNPVNAGSGRFTQAFGGFLTLNHGQLEIDASLEYAITMPNPQTGANPGDVVQGSLSAAYHPNGLWTGLEAMVRHSGDDERLGEQTAAGQTVLAAGPEVRLLLGDGFLAQVGGRIGTHGARMAEARVFYNF